MLHAGLYNDAFEDHEKQHRLHQLYNAVGEQFPSEHLADVDRFASQFYREHEPPQWIELVNLRQAEEAVQISTRLQQGPADGRTDGREIPEGAEIEMSVRPWVWDEAIWHYEDGRQAVYPAYDDVDW